MKIQFYQLATCCALAFAPLAGAKPHNAPEALQKAALRIDRYVAAFFKKQNLPVPDVADDATFLRRTYLTVAGRVPTLDEAVAFLDSEDPGKRAALIARLLDAPGYGSHMANWAFDLIRVTDQRENTSLAPYRHWVRTAMDENLPWDEFTRRLLASRGSAWDEEHAAVGYYVRDRAMPNDNLANSMRIFLGTRMECAQCHDDPFGPTKRIDFYQLAAFTHGQQPMRNPHLDDLVRELADYEGRPPLAYEVARMLEYNIIGLTLAGGGNARMPLPSDFQYRGGRPGEMIGARTPFGRTMRSSANRTRDDGRETLADWMTNHTGLHFPAVIANRMWKRVMGVGLTEPVDDFRPIADGHHPELHTALAELMVELGYDLRAFQHALLLTRTYQFQANPKPSSLFDGDDFHGRQIRRLSAEQIWDSLVTLTQGDPDGGGHRYLDDTIRLQGRPILVGKKTMTDLSTEVLALRTRSQFRSYFEELMAMIEAERNISTSGAPAMAMQARGGGSGMVRASELPSPAPAGHFLRMFGQSDREVVDASSREANVGQVLALMNGFVQRRLIHNPEAQLHQQLADAGDMRDSIRLACIAILTRPPTEVEMRWMLDEVEARGEDGLRNLISALVMSSEFLFLQ